MRNSFLFILLTVFLVSAHFEIFYTPSVEFDGSEVSLTNFFSHAYDGHHLMKSGLSADGKVLGLKEAFYVHKGKKNDVTKSLKKVNYSSESTKAPGYDLTLSNLKTMGDYVVVVVPYPYWEPEENLYIQQITKLFLNKGGLDTDWMNRCTEGHTEIIPLCNPYNITPGQIFRGKVVDNDGKPVEGAVVEVEFLNYAVDMKNHTFQGKATIDNDKIGTATLITDVNGIFAFVPQVKGYWGFAALSAGSDKEYKGKELEQDPVIWIQVTK